MGPISVYRPVYACMCVFVVRARGMNDVKLGLGYILYVISDHGRLGRRAGPRQVWPSFIRSVCVYIGYVNRLDELCVFWNRS